MLLDVVHSHVSSNTDDGLAGTLARRSLGILASMQPDATAKEVLAEGQSASCHLRFERPPSSHRDEALIFCIYTLCTSVSDIRSYLPLILFFQAVV